jgi:hypothetical protein
MNTSPIPRIAFRFSILAAAATIAVLSYAQDTAVPEKKAPASGAAIAPTDAKKMTSTTSTASTSGQPDAAEMAKMMELAKPGENHKVLAELAGNWSYTVKMFMAPGTPPSESKGNATRKLTMDGRYVTGEYAGKFKMPGADGKMKDMEFKGMSVDGYDNVKQKFVSSWIDNMGTGIMLSEGTYDPSTKTFTFTGDYEALPGSKSKVREVIKIADKTHQSMEYFEDRGQGEAKTMEINYSRK